MSIFQGYKSAKPRSIVLAAGKHLVNVLRMVLTDSFNNPDGSVKGDPVWDVPTIQMLVTFGNEKGSIMHRFNGKGYMKTSEMDPQLMVEQGLVDVDGYACKLLSNGRYQRIDSEENTASCKNIFDRFLWNCGIPEGSTLDEINELIADNEIKVMIEVEPRVFEGKERLEVTRISKAESLAAQLELKSDLV